MYFGARRSFIDPIYCNVHVFEVGFGQSFIFFARHQLDTCTLASQKARGTGRDSVGVESSRLGLKSECADTFHQSFLW